MHPNPIFRRAPARRNTDLARRRGFGTLALDGTPDGDDAQGPLLAHVPFWLGDDASFAELHLVRSNPILGLLEKPRAAVIAVTGPDGYVSPDWYGVPDQVPTWNYVAVHLRGRLERLPQAALPGLLDRLSAAFEARLAPKPPWTADKMDLDARDRMLRQIVPCRLQIENIDGTWKLGQNKPEEARLGAARAIADGGIGQDLHALSDFMHDLPEE